MVKTLLVPATRPDEPSPWWLKGGAIFIGVLGFSSLIGAVALAVSGFYLEIMVESLDTQEICAEDPDPEECEAVFEAILQISEMKLWDVGAAFSALLFLLSIPTAIIMWNAEDRDMALKLAWVWISIHAISQLYITHTTMEWMDNFYDSIPSEQLALVSVFQSVASYGGVILCEFSLAAGLALISYQTRPPTSLEVPSAFHTVEQE